MGYPIYSNIFSDNPIDSEELRRFPIQAAVLYSPADRSFADAFRQVFLELDRITGDNVIFFAVLDPPEEWLRVARERAIWPKYWERRPLGHEINDRMLVNEIARRFGVQWSDLPAIVVSTDLWSAKFVTTRTSPDHIASQLAALTELAKERRKNNDLDLSHIRENLQDKFGFPVRYHPPGDLRRRDLSQFYEILSANLEMGYNQLRRVAQYWNDISRNVRLAQSSLEIRLRAQHQVVDLQDLASLDTRLKVMAGRLIPFVALNERVTGLNVPSVLGKKFDLPNMNLFIAELQERNDIVDALDDESLTMINTALRTAVFLDAPNPLAPIIQGSKNRPPLQEYAPAGQGLWKAYEREINKSVVQAMRNARTIEMPQFFARYRPKFAGRNYIETPKPIDINQKDRKDPLGVGHRFIELGIALKCVNALQGKTNEQFDQVIRRCLGRSPLPAQLLVDWKVITERRNPASHTEVLSRDGFREVAKGALRSGNLETLMKIKRALSS